MKFHSLLQAAKNTQKWYHREIILTAITMITIKPQTIKSSLLKPWTSVGTKHVMAKTNSLSPKPKTVKVMSQLQHQFHPQLC